MTRLDRQRRRTCTAGEDVRTTAALPKPDGVDLLFMTGRTRRADR